MILNNLNNKIMVGGKIEDFNVLQRADYISLIDDDYWDIQRAHNLFDRMEKDSQQMVYFLVVDNYIAPRHCCVKAIVPAELLHHKLIQKGDGIWWQSGKVLLELIGVADNQYEKIGASGGSKVSYYLKMDDIHAAK